MESATLQTTSPYQRMIVERALALAREMERTAIGSPHGQALDRCEQVLMGDGRELLRTCPEGALQAGVDEAEKRGHPPGPVHAATPAGTRDATPRPS
jgi:hypothetical protein